VSYNEHVVGSCNRERHAATIKTIRVEFETIERNIRVLIDDMQRSIAQATEEQYGANRV
jgi:hypothetical protein